MTNTAVKQKPHKDSVDVRFAKVETTLPFLATKAELKEEIANVRADIANVRIEVTSVRTELKQDIADVRADIANVRAELKEDISKVRTELKQDIADVKDAINIQTKWFMGIIITIILSVFGSTIGILLKLSSH
ncbi:hypothetical protein C0030_003675 [Candidatus Liberibacter solanacearum]|uniref:DUF1640 domain-containing protein n=1 Tax=Candidatus Liberibacter solanacearum TaxID=556287 RepID=A0A424FM15_9HYPH|nr:hypothetical protein [Candidatus Liberibacter solanacearum]RPD37178.1 hypothetical protein C0030_003675 [Candidatus Liberibacter solanacearum]